MLKHFQSGRWVMLISSSPKLPFAPKPTSSKSAADSRYFRTCSASADALHILRPRRALSICWAARRRAVRYDDDGEDEEEEEYGHHKEIAVLELYSQSVRGEALIVHAVVDDQDGQVLIFKSTEIWGPDAMAGTGHAVNVQLELIESSRVLIGQDGIRQQEFSIRPVNICVESI
ncbi:hypothetical protein CerSpe_276290 [Prunus speciosa]